MLSGVSSQAVLYVVLALGSGSGTAYAMAPAAPAAPVLAVPKAPVVPAIGHYCAALAANGVGKTDPNTAQAWGQNDAIFLDKNGQHSPDLCGPIAATHLTGGYADYPSVVAGSAVARAGASDETDYAAVERSWANTMDTDGINLDFLVTDIHLSGTLGMDFHGPLKQELIASLKDYGSFPMVPTTSYSNLAPANVTASTLAEPVCQSIWQGTTPGSGYDYSKTLDMIQIGFFNIDEVYLPYPCGDWWSAGLDKWCEGDTGFSTVMYENGHFIPFSGVNPSDGTVAIDNRQEGWSIIWETFGSETVKIAGFIPVLDHVASMNVPGAGSYTSLLLGYNQTTVTHGGACPAGEFNPQSGSSRGTCVP